MVLATVPLVLAHPVASEATGGLVVQLPVVSSQHCFMIGIESLCLAAELEPWVGVLNSKMLPC